MKEEVTEEMVKEVTEGGEGRGGDWNEGDLIRGGEER